MKKTTRTTKTIIKNIICSGIAFSLCSPIMTHALISDSSSTESIIPEPSPTKAITPDSSSTEEGSTTSKSTKTYRIADLNKLSYVNMINLLVTLKWNDITDLFQDNSDAVQFYSDRGRIQALIDAIQVRGSQFTSSDDKGLPTLIEVLRAGYYIASSNEKLKFLRDRKERDKGLPAMKSIQKNVNFKLGSKTTEQVIQNLGIWVGNASCDVEVVNGFASILKQYYERLATSSNNLSTRNVVYEIMKNVELDVDRCRREKSGKFNRTLPWEEKIDSYIKEMDRIALYGPVNNDDNVIINNAIYYTGIMGDLRSNPDEGNKILTQALRLYPNFSAMNLTAARGIHNHYKGIDALGNQIHIDTMLDKARNEHLPRTYSFDSGSFRVKTGDQVTVQQVKRLYWAFKEVKAQFHRINGNDEPFPTKNPDGTLTAIIYNSPEHYKMNYALYGHSPDNGGTYIERERTFYTYKRTTSESIFSLEELFRHECVHHLQATFQQPSPWGNGPLYKHNQMPWFNEGEAEFITGSTRTTGVLPRKSIISRISTEPAERFTVSRTLHSTYEKGWKFYTYSSALFDYFYQKDMATYMKLVQLLKANDGAGFKRYMEQLSQDSRLLENYQQHMQKLKNQYNQLSNPRISDNYLAGHAPRNLTNIVTDIQNVASLQNVTATVKKSDSFYTFNLRGTYTGQASRGKLQDWKRMNELANQFLQKLDTYPWTGYKTVTCYFINYRVNAMQQFEYDVVFHGLLTDISNAAIIKDKPMQPTQPTQPTPSIGYRQKPIPISLNKTITSKLEEHLGENTYYFNVKSPGKFDIVVNQLNSAQMDWKLYEDDKDHNPVGDNFIAYPTKRDNNQLSSSVNLQPGKYYLVVYKYSEADASYTVQVSNNNENSEVTTDVDKPRTTKDMSRAEIPKRDKPVQTNDPSVHAEQPIFLSSHHPITGNLAGHVTQHVYSFEVKSSSRFDIVVKQLNKEPVDWQLYDHKDRKNCITYPKKRDNNQLSDSIDLQPGKYDLVVYKYSEADASYTVQVSNNNENSEVTTDVDKPRTTKDMSRAEIPKRDKPVQTNDPSVHAEQPIFLSSHHPITGNLAGHVTQHVYSFEVKSSSRFDIVVKQLNKEPVDWQLYDHKDRKNCITYPKKRDNNQLSDSIDLQPGKYDLVVYKYSEADASYTVQISNHNDQSRK